MSNEILTVAIQVSRAVIVVLLLYGLIRPAFASAICAWADRVGARKRSMFLLILLGALVLTATLLLRHFGFETDAYDLRLHEEVVRNTWQGKFMYSDMKGYSFFANHASLIFPIFALVYPVWPSAAWLLILQGLCIGGAAWFLWLFVREHDARPAVAVAVVAVFMTYYGLWTGFFDGFHQEVVSVFFVLGFLWAVKRSAAFPAALFGALALSCREDIAIPLAVYGAMLCFVRGRRAWGGVILALCAVWMGITYGWLIPKCTAGGTMEEFSRWSQFGSTPKAVALGMLAHPLLVLGNVARGSFVLLGRLFFLPVLDPWTVLPVLIPLAAHTSSSYDMQAHLQGAYAALFVPFFFAGLVRTLARPRFKRWLSLDRFAFCFSLLLVLINVKALPLPDSWAGVASAQRGLSLINRHIDGYRVLAQGSIVPHLGWTAQVDMLGSPGQKPLDDYGVILLSATQRTWPLSQADVEEAIRSLGNSNRWHEVRFGCVECFFKVGDTNLQAAVSAAHYE
jgi:uncharacterized membrane protein